MGLFSSFGTDLTTKWKTQIFPLSNLFSSIPSVFSGTDKSIRIKRTVYFLFLIPTNSQLCVHGNISARLYRSNVYATKLILFYLTERSISLYISSSSSSLKVSTFMTMFYPTRDLCHQLQITENTSEIIKNALGK